MEIHTTEITLTFTKTKVGNKVGNAWWFIDHVARTSILDSEY